MTFAINILALLLVLGLCWVAMMWLTGKSHGHGGGGGFDDLDDFSRLNEPGPCPVCEGLGAQQTRGVLAPCPECQGTGVTGVR